MTVTVIAAVLAIVLTLALATRLNDLARPPAPTGTASTPPKAQARAADETWAMNPFARVLSAPVAVPWAPTQR
jgi:hypothetical protein